MSGWDELGGHAFISYVREDSRNVDELQRKLEAAGIPVWRDTADLWPGEDWRVKIRRAITDNALAFIACFSRVSVGRNKSYQNEELLLAIEQLRQRRPDDPWLIPVRFDDCEIPDLVIGGGRTLASIQHADLFGDHAHEGSQRLIATVLRILGRSARVGRARDLPEDLRSISVDPAQAQVTHAVASDLSEKEFRVLQSIYNYYPQRTPISRHPGSDFHEDKLRGLRNRGLITTSNGLSFRRSEYVEITPLGRLVIEDSIASHDS